MTMQTTVRRKLRARNLQRFLCLEKTPRVFDRVDVFGDFEVKSKDRQVLLRTSDYIRGLGVRNFVERAESQGIDEVVVENLDSNHVQLLFSETPSIFSEPEIISTELRLTPGQSDDERC
jgi:hypothetical protein